MAKFDMAQFLADAGVNLDTGNREQIEYIPIDRIVPDANNFYELSGLDDLAANISLLGLQQPIRVRPMPEDDSKYIIISGHRRHAALKLLVEQDGRDDLREVPCIVERGEENPKLTELKLIYANASTRVLSSAEQAKQVNRLRELLYQLKEDGMEFKGRMRDIVAEACKISAGKIARLDVISKGLIPAFVPAWESGALNESAAYELARMSATDQTIIFTLYQGKENTLQYATVTNVKEEMERANKSIPSSSVCKSLGCFCPELANRKNQAAKLKSWESLSCQENTCCLDCWFLQSCTHPCAEAKAKQKELRKVAKDAEKESAQRVAEQRQPAVDAITESWKRMCSLAKDKRIDAKSVFTACRGWSCSSDCDDMQKYADGQKKFAFNDSMPGTLAYESAKKLIATADLLGCSIDYLLGRTDTPTLAAAPAAAPEKCVQFDTWHTAPPDDPGEYVVYISLSGMYAADTICWTGRDWDNPYADSDVIAWTYPPDAEETK